MDIGDIKVLILNRTDTTLLEMFLITMGVKASNIRIAEPDESVALPIERGEFDLVISDTYNSSRLEMIGEHQTPIYFFDYSSPSNLDKVHNAQFRPIVGSQIHCLGKIFKEILPQSA